MTKIHVAAIAAILTAPAAALAEPVAKTITIDRPKYEGTKTVTRDREAGTVSKDAEVTRKSDGATATREYDRQRTEDGWTASGSRTRFDGDTRSWEYQRDRTRHGYNAEGTLTTAGGKTYELDAKVRRNDNHYMKKQVVRNDDGRIVAARKVQAHRTGHGPVIKRTVRRRGR